MLRHVSAEKIVVGDGIQRRNEFQQNQQDTRHPESGSAQTPKSLCSQVCGGESAATQNHRWLPLPGGPEELEQRHSHTAKYTRLKITIQTASTKCQYSETAPSPEVSLAPKL